MFRLGIHGAELILLFLILYHLNLWCDFKIIFQFQIALWFWVYLLFVFPEYRISLFFMIFCKYKSLQVMNYLIFLFNIDRVNNLSEYDNIAVNHSIQFNFVQQFKQWWSLIEQMPSQFCPISSAKTNRLNLRASN